jgi:predicted porin
MKKSLIALAVLAASGASFAQSSVTLYGIADIWFGKTSGDGVTSQTVLQSGGVSGSRYGFKGSEDLGGGLKANFLLENGFNIDTGAGTTGQAISRQSYVGFSGGFGEVKLGKMWTPYDDISGAANSVFDSALAAQNGVWLSTGYNANPSNSIYYSSPSMGGFSGALSYSFGENKTATLNAGSVVSMNVQYANGPLFVGLAYQQEKAQDGNPYSVDAQGTVTAYVAPTAVEKTSFTRLNATYDLGSAKLLAGYGRVSAPANEVTTEWELGVDVPVSSALTLSGGIARSSDDFGGDAKRTGYGLGAAYSLSKRTTVYGGFQSSKESLAGVDTTARVAAIGVKHTF